MVEIENNRKYLNNEREYQEHFLDDGFSNPGIRIIHNGIVLPKSDLYAMRGGVTDENGEFVKESSVDHEGTFMRIIGGYDIAATDVDESRRKEEVIYLGYFLRHWGHFLMDCSTRMWILLDDQYKDCKIVFPNHPGVIRDGNYDRFLELLGVNENRIVSIDRPTRFKEVIVPDEGRLSSKNIHSGKWYAIFDKVVENAQYDKKNIPKKVYFSRSRFGKPELGEEEIQRNFEINGYAVVYPERLSLDEQIGIFQCAEEVVSQNSSICMNVVFAKEGLKWLIINKYSAIHDNFTELRYRKKLDLTYIDAYSDRFNKYGNMIGTMPYLVSFNENLKRYFMDHSMGYETFGVGYRIKNVVVYLWKCSWWNCRRRINMELPRVVRLIKRKAPRLYKAIKVRI
ncbi:MAG: glycosyltransferase family 61 protein [Lachnospiraceae bacterium]|nr:glycosyltransferase family 61 protein [Lachnospiraceae bacterium]